MVMAMAMEEIGDEMMNNGGGSPSVWCRWIWWMAVVVVNRQMPWDGLSWGRMCARGFGGGFSG